MEKHNLIEHSPSCKYLAAHCQIKQNHYDEALIILGEKNPTHLISTSAKSRRKLQHHPSSSSNSLLQRNGTSLLSRPSSKHSRPDRIDRSEEREKEREREDASDLKFEAAMCYLRGICYAKQNAFDRAKECYKDAVLIDVQCFEAFDQLMKNSLLKPDEEWAFLESLDFDSIPSPTPDPSSAQEAAHFTKMLYTTRLSKYKNPASLGNAIDTLSTHYHLAQTPDLLLAKADLLFTQCRFYSALTITTQILSADEFNFAVLPLHLSLLYELEHTPTLFLLAHRLADSHPHEATTWLAVAIYYLSTGKIAEARRFFSKASQMDTHFGAAWIGFAHTFALEGEHDQAIAAYSTAVRLFQGTHLPQLFLGMQNLLLNNLHIATEYLQSAYTLCNSDPLVLNELGVAMYHGDNLGAAIHHFSEALEIAENVEAEPAAWLATRANLGHAFRRCGRWEDALAQFERVLREGGVDAGVLCAKGLVLMEMGKAGEAVGVLHLALGIRGQDPVGTDLLNRALEENARQLGIEGEGEDEELNDEVARRIGNASARKGKRRVGEEDSMMVTSDVD